MTSEDKDHVSTFDLDIYWASGCSPDAAMGLHLAGCTQCRAYLAGLDVLRAAATPAAATTPAQVLASTAVPAPRPRTSRSRWALPIAGAVALAASGLLLVRSKLMDAHDYVAVKGTPGVQLLVHRGGETRIWDGQSPVHPGDALALRVACKGLEHVAVAAPAMVEWRRLSPDAICPNEGDPLPFTLVVDDQPGDEKLAVVLSREALDDAALRRAIADDRRTSDVWVVQLELRKAAETDR